MLPEKLLGNSIQLCGDLPKILIQIQCACTDQVATQVEQAIRGDGRLRFGINQKPGNISGMCDVLILYIGIDKMHCDETIVKLASIVLVVGFQFLLNKFVTFKYNFDK